ncbi:MAG: sigma-70 family RNA polymerase sigma factor [Candidatus Omnitrophota bacterium]
MTVELLLKKCIEKDMNAWDDFVRLYHALVARSVRYKLYKMDMRLPRDEVMDIVQDIFLAIWEKDKLSCVTKPASLKGWLVIVSFNMTHNYCKRSLFKTDKTLFSLNDPISPSSPGLTLEDVLPSEKFNTLEAAEANELNEAVEKAISDLSSKHQLVLKFNIYDGQKQKDIARIMKIPEGTVAVILRRGKKHLREKLMGKYSSEV